MKAKIPYKKRRKRLGRGLGSGHGKTCTRGHKGQNSRSGVSQRVGFEGGQNPLYRRLPKLGFSQTAFRKEYVVINVGKIAQLKEKEVSPETLKSAGVFKEIRDGVKVLGDGELKQAVTIKAHRFSESAKSKIEKAGGQALLIERPKKKSSEPETKSES